MLNINIRSEYMQHFQQFPVKAFFMSLHIKIVRIVNPKMILFHHLLTIMLLNNLHDCLSYVEYKIRILKNVSKKTV